MATNALLELQKKFNLFQVGDNLQGNIVSIVDNSPQLQLTGGALGFISAENNKLYQSSGIKLKVGNVIGVEVSEIIDGIPYLQLPEEFVRRNSVWKAVVKFSGTQALVVEILPQKEIGFYQFSAETEDNLRLLNPGTPLLCKGLEFVEDQGFYTIAEIKQELENNIPKPLDFTIPEPWNDAEFTAASLQGGIQSKGVYRLGEVYVGRFSENRFVSFDDKTKAMIKHFNGHSPKDDDYLLVRIIKIYEFGDFKDVELLDIVNKDYVNYFKKVRPKQLLPSAKSANKKKKDDVYDCGFNFSQRDNVIFNEGVKTGSIERFEKYWLGFLYKAEVSEGKPVFTYNSGFPINVKLIDNDDVIFMDGHIVFCRLCYIENNNGKVTLSVRPEFCREKNDSDKF